MHPMPTIAPSTPPLRHQRADTGGGALLLGGDLGGTKTLLALVEALPDGSRRIVAEARYASRDWPDFGALLADFRARHPGAIAAACFGVAGPVDGPEDRQTARLTYLPWRLDAQALADEFALGRVRIVNDFYAAASGIDSLPAEACTVLQAGSGVADAPRVVVGAGTGLGVAGVLRHGGETIVVPGEGGHQGFAPQSAQQAALWQYLFAQNGRVTSEDVVSGPGLARIHAFLGGGERSPAEIGAAALRGDDPLASGALSLWLEAYGAFAGDLALAWLARGGVWLAGGIAAKLMGAAQAAIFLAAFNAKREHRQLVESMPVVLVHEERLGLLGALALAQLR